MRRTEQLRADDLWGLGWRSVFLINLPVGVGAIVGAWRLLPHDPQARGTALDLAGTAWCLLAALAWAVPLVQGPEQGWTPVLLACLATAPAWTLALWRHCRRLEARGGRPIVQPALMQDRGYRGGLFVSLLCSGLLPGYLFGLTLAWPGLLAQALMGLGVGFIGPPLTAVTLQAVPRDQAGGASGVVNAGRQFAAVGAVAMVAALMHAAAPAAPTPATWLAALPGLLLLMALGAWAAWRLPPTVPIGTPAAAH